MKLSKAIHREIKSQNKLNILNRFKKNFLKFFSVKTLEQEVYDRVNEDTYYVVEYDADAELVYSKLISGGHCGTPYGLIKLSDEYISKFRVDNEIITCKNKEIYCKTAGMIGTTYDVIVRCRHFKDGHNRKAIIALK